MRIWRSLGVGTIVSLTLLVAPPARGEASAMESIDDLIASSTLIGQNRGWVAQTAGETKGTRFDLIATAAKGLILMRGESTSSRINAGQFRITPGKFSEQCANALMAAQQRSGYVPAFATFLRGGARAEFEQSPILPRNATAATAAFLLLCSADPEHPQPRAKAAGKLAINWLIQQQLGVGGFLSPTTQPNTGRHPVRQIDLATTDYRNSMLALLLANEIEPSKPIAIAAEKAANRLLALRLMNQAGSPATRPESDDTDEQRKMRAALQLWAARYEAAGDVAPGNNDADLRATSQAVQMLLAEALLTDNSRWANELAATRFALQTLQSDGRWLPKQAALPTTQPTSDESESVFGPAKTLPIADTFHLPPLLATIDALQTQAGPEVAKQLSATESLTDRMAGSICGLRRTLVETSDTVDGRLWDALHRPSPTSGETPRNADSP